MLPQENVLSCLHPTKDMSPREQFHRTKRPKFLVRTTLNAAWKANETEEIKSLYAYASEPS